MFQSLNKTTRKISKYQVKDSNTWANIFQEYLQERESIFKSTNNPSYVSKYREHRNSDELNYFQQFRIEIQSMKSWCNELFNLNKLSRCLTHLQPSLGFHRTRQGAKTFVICSHVQYKIRVIMLSEEVWEICHSHLRNF